ncbi:helix-turn-helix domain-containing protein [Krasilnikovia sp. MM14-A1259]|uniref:helix-turn-helix domain-containing protein n=1 Tax=Krasilnikovia sp. MM14-A1259 TaxID=3373539 RepID=UPI00381C0AC0
MCPAADGARAGDAVPVRRFELATDEPEQAVEIVRATYAGTRIRISGDAGAFRYRQRTIEAGPLAVDDITNPITVGVDCPPYRYLCVATARRAQASFHAHGDELQIGAGDTIAYPVGEPFTGTTRDMDTRLLRLSLAPVAARAGMDPDTFRLTALTPTSPAMGRHVRATVHFLHRALADPDTALSHPLALTSALDVAVSAVLAAFPHTSDPTAVGSRRVRPAVIRRAVAFIDAHPDQPITLADIAAAAGISVRGLHHGFRRHLDTTPTVYLRRVRLAHAHHDLHAAAYGDAVAAVARRWGFGHPGRFAGYYRTVYGRPPSDTGHD